MLYLSLQLWEGDFLSAEIGKENMEIVFLSRFSEKLEFMPELC